MANTKISELPALGATPENGDVLAIVDTSASATKKVTVSELLSGVPAGFDPNVDNPAIGNGSSAGTDSVSIGHDAIGSGASTVLIGQNADGGTNARATGIGSDVTVSGADATAYGHDASAAASCTAVGTEARAISSLSCSFGAGADALAASSVAVGYNASVASIAEFGVAIGRQATVGNDDGVAIGYLANAGAANTLHLNASGVATNAPSTAGHMVIETDDAKLEYNGNWDMSGGTLTLGAVTYPATDGTANQVLTTDGAGNISFADAGGGGGFDPNTDNPAIGNGATTGTDSVAYGHDATASGTRDVAIGPNVQVTNGSGFNNTALGSDITFGTSTLNDIAIGHGISISNGVTGATVIGYEATTTGSSDYQVVVGYQATASGADGIAMGRTASASGADSISIGKNSDATQVGAVAVGPTAQATGVYATAINEGLASGANSIAIGPNSDATSNAAIAIGSLSNALNANTIHINASGTNTAVNTAGHMRIETDDAAIVYDGNWDMTNGTLTLGAVTYPNTDGTANQVLTTDGAGNLSFADAGGGGGFDPNVDNPTIGNGASAGSDAVALGHDATAGAFGAVAIGNGSNAFADSIGIGNDADTTGNYGISIGRSSDAFTDCIAMGRSANASQAESIAIGTSVTATSGQAVSIGSQSDATAASAIALGHLAQATGSTSVALGYHADATSGSAVAIGDNAQSTRDNSVALGHDTQATANGAIAIGDNAQATLFGQNAIAIGHDAVAPAVSAVVIGDGANVSNNNSYGGYTVAIGYAASVEGTRSIAIGRQADIGFNNSNCVAIGYFAQIPDSSYQESMALGASARVQADNAIHINASGATTNGPTVNGQIVIESDEAKLEYVSGNWSLTPGNLEMYNGTAPTTSVTDGIILYAEDVSSSSELKVRDEAGNVTTLSPHNFELIPEGPSEDMAWSYYSERDGKRINVDMLKALRVLERMSGEQLVFED